MRELRSLAGENVLLWLVYDLSQYDPRTDCSIQVELTRPDSSALLICMRDARENDEIILIILKFILKITKYIEIINKNVEIIKYFLYSL